MFNVNDIQITEWDQQLEILSQQGLILTQRTYESSLRKQKENITNSTLAHALERMEEKTTSRQTLQDTNIVFQLNELVTVRSRLWPGINKPGGIGRIVKCQELNGLNYYDVKYILDKKVDKLIEQCFLLKSEESSEITTLTSTHKRHRKSNSHLSNEIIILSSTLEEEEFSLLTRFVTQFKVSTTSNDEDPYTHLIMSTDDNLHLDKRTRKFMQSILGKNYTSSL
jgi:hypothetical protein